MKKSITSTLATCAIAFILPQIAAAGPGHYDYAHKGRSPITLHNGSKVTLHNGSVVTTKWEHDCGCESKPVISGPYYVFFAHDSSAISAEGRSTIKRAYHDAMHHGAKEYRLSGHASKPGKEGYNMKLSEKRVNAVASTLSGMGIDHSKVMTAAFGETVPFHKDSGMNHPSKDRRVELRYFYAK